MDGKFRRVEVKINPGKYKLAYRRGYNADDSLAQEARSESDPLHPLLMHGLPSATQLLFAVRVLPAGKQPEAKAARAGENAALAGPLIRYNVDFLIRWSDVALQATQNQTHTGKIQIDLLAYDRDGNPLNWAGGAQVMNLTPEVYAAIQKSGIPAHLEIDLPNTDVYLETGVYDWSSGKAGTLEIPIHPAPQAATTVQHPAPSIN